MSEIAHTFIVLSGKGGVGKSSVAVNLAVWLSSQGKQVGLLDADIHGPSVPKLLAAGDRKLAAEGERIEPIAYSESLKIISVGFILPNEDEALIWRGPMKHNLIQQFVEQVNWGRLDFLVVDCPPGTGDEPLSVIQVLGGADGAVIVTTPQELAAIDVRKCITFCKHVGLSVLGIIENMSGFVCPHCNTRSDILAGHSGAEMARDFRVPFLGSIPIDPAFAGAGDRGRPFVTVDPDNPAAQALRHAFEPLLDSRRDQRREPTEEPSFDQENHDVMRVAIPLTAGRLSAHFGHCEQFAIVQVDRESKEIRGQERVTPPAHEPGLLPRWLADQQVNVVIARGMGQRAQGLFTRQGIDVLTGAPEETPERLVHDFLAGILEVGDNVCDH
jgi:Mrp family chromosome partitioning ATPase/predicted Fe-Mo cluster-binding NifX family protein